jgi:hypothetical protein
MRSDELKRIAVGRIALKRRDRLVHEMTAALPEARVTKQILDDHTSRVVTFDLLSTEER